MSTDDFEFFSFTVFETDSLQKVKTMIEKIFKEKFVLGKAMFVKDTFDLSVFFNPCVSGCKEDFFIFWKDSKYENRILFTSNSADGRITLCNCLSDMLLCNFFQCKMTSSKSKYTYPLNSINYKRAGAEIERCVLVYKDPKWTFYEVGQAEDFENLEFYKKKFIKDRLNPDIIISYLSKYGIDFKYLGQNTQDYFAVRISL